MDPGMRSILVGSSNSTPFLAQDPTVGSESDFEALCLKVLPLMLSGCHVFRFKPLVLWNGEGWRPDLIFVDKEFKYWTVVEVETEVHSLQKHVLPQVRAFRDGEFKDDAAGLIADGIGRTIDDARTLIAYGPRYVAVVSNWPNPEWKRSLAAESVQFMSIQVFRDGRGEMALLTEGTFVPGIQAIGFGVVLSKDQVIRIPAGAFWAHGIYRIADQLGQEEWICVIEKGFAWLTKRRGMITLPEGTYVQFLCREDGTVVLRTL